MSTEQKTVLVNFGEHKRPISIAQNADLLKCVLDEYEDILEKSDFGGLQIYSTIWKEFVDLKQTSYNTVPDNSKLKIILKGSKKRHADLCSEGTSKRYKLDEETVVLMFVHPGTKKFWNDSKDIIRKRLINAVTLPNGNTLPTSTANDSITLESIFETTKVKIYAFTNNRSLVLLLSTPPLPWRDIFLYLSSSLSQAITTEFTLVIRKDGQYEKFEIPDMMTELCSGNYILLPNDNIELSLCVPNFINISRSTMGSDNLSEIDSTNETKELQEGNVKESGKHKKIKRGNVFRERVKLKSNACAFCGYSSMEDLNLQSAHIVDHARINHSSVTPSISSILDQLHDGIDATENGIRLCGTCHANFGYGIIAMYKLESDYIMLVLVDDYRCSKRDMHLCPINPKSNYINSELVKFHLQNSIARHLRNQDEFTMKANADVSNDNFYDDDVGSYKVQASKVIDQRVEEWVLQSISLSQEDSNPTSQEESVVEESSQDQEEGSSYEESSMQYQSDVRIF